MLETNRQRLMIMACIERHPSAWEDFLDDYLPLLHQVVCEVESQMRFQESPDGVLREEILAGVLTGLIEKDLSLLRYYRAESGLDAYLVVVARRLAIDLWQSAMSRTGVSVNRDIADDNAKENAQTIDEVESMLGKLKPLEREAVRLHYLEGCSSGEVARQLKLPMESIGPLLARARRKIQQSRTKQ